MKTRAEADAAFVVMLAQVFPRAQQFLSQGHSPQEFFETFGPAMMPVVIEFFGARRRSERAHYIAALALKLMPRDTAGQQPAERRAAARLAVEQVALVLDEAESYIEGETMEGEAN